MAGILANRGQKEQCFKETFKAFDKDGSGYISPDELREGLKQLGVNINAQDADRMIKEADRNGDGRVDYAEFSKLMASFV